MLAAQGPSQDPEFLMLVMLIIIALAVIFWRVAIKLAVISMIFLLVLGLSELLRILH
jgi:hypothetical protein